MSLTSITVSLNWSSEETLPWPYTYTLKVLQVILTTYHCRVWSGVINSRLKQILKRRGLQIHIEHNEELDRTYFSQYFTYIQTIMIRAKCIIYPRRLTILSGRQKPSLIHPTSTVPCRVPPRLARHTSFPISLSAYKGTK